MRLALRITSAIAALAAAASTQAAVAEPPLAFTSVNLLPMTAGEPLIRDQTVIVAGGRIAAVGPATSVQVPRDAVRIDGRGKYLMPGLADMHVHLEHFDNPAYLKLFLINGVTFVRSMDGRPEILEWKRAAAAGALESPDIHTAGPVLDGSPPVRDDNVALATPEQARQAVADQAAAGYDFIKVYANLSPDVFEAIMMAARERGLPVAGHVPRAVGLDAFLASDVKSIEHLSDFADSIAAQAPSTGAPPAFLKRRFGFAADPARMSAVAAKVAKSGKWVAPTIIADDRLVAPPTLVEQWAKAPEAASVDRGILRYYWRGVLERASERLAAGDWQWVERGRANRIALLRALHAAGVPLLIGTDTPQPFVFPGSSVHQELETYVAAGFTPAEALAAATREPAKFLGQEESWGTVEEGKRASLLLLDGNPLEEISATRRIAGVVARGRWIPATRLAEMREQVEMVAAASE